MKNHLPSQSGASLIEVLVAILILSFGMLSLGAMMSFGVQLPKLAGYRATATSLASNYVERVRANPNAFTNNLYSVPLYESSAWSFLDIDIPKLIYPDCLYADPCTEATLARMDVGATRRAVRRALPAGDLIMKCDVAPCTQAGYGNLWVVWQEPSTFATLDSGKSDNCPTEVTTAYTAPAPRCLYLRFKIE